MEDQADDQGSETKFVISKDIDILTRWLQIRTENGYDMPRDISHFKITCLKSALLHRMLEGKEPFPIPPPRAFSYPWYDLIENGIAHPYEVWAADDEISFVLTDYPALVIDQSPWKILEKLEEDSWIITYQYGPDEDRKFAEDKWHVYCVGSNIQKTGHSSDKLWEIKKIS